MQGGAGLILHAARRGQKKNQTFSFEKNYVFFFFFLLDCDENTTEDRKGNLTLLGSAFWLVKLKHLLLTGL